MATITVLETRQTTTSGTDGGYVFDAVPVCTDTRKIETNRFETIYLPGFQVIEGQSANAPASEMTITQASQGLPRVANSDGKLGLDDSIYILYVISGAK